MESLGLFFSIVQREFVNSREWVVSTLYIYVQNQW